MPGSGHQSPGLWKHPDDKSVNFNNINHWVDLAKLLEAGHFQGMFIADVYVCIHSHLPWKSGVSADCLSIFH